MAVKVVTENDIGQGLEIVAAKLKAKVGAGLQFDGAGAIETVSVPTTVALANPSGPNLQATVNGVNSNVLDLTPLIQAGETTTTLTYNPATKTLTYTNEAGTVANVDLSALAVDIFVNGGSYDAGTMVLTLTDNAGTTPDITINLADLKQVVSQATDSVTFTGTGEASSPLQANLKLDPLAGNLLQVTAAGVKVDPADITVTNGIGIRGNGQAGTPLELAADELPSPAIDTGEPANNFVMSTPLRPAGQLVPVLNAAEAVWVGYVENEVNNLIPTVVTAMMTVAVQDLAGNHLFYALP